MARLSFFLTILAVGRLALATPVPEPAPLSFSEYVEKLIENPDLAIDPEYAANVIHPSGVASDNPLVNEERSLVSRLFEPRASKDTVCNTIKGTEARINDAVRCINQIAAKGNKKATINSPTALCTIGQARITAVCSKKCPASASYQNMARGVARVMDKCTMPGSGTVQGQSLAWANGNIVLHIRKP